MEIDINDYITWDGYNNEHGTQFDVPFPRCNHIKGVGQYNVGYAQGCINDGTPFEAEVFTNDEDEVWLAVVLPCSNVAEDAVSISNKEKCLINSYEWDKSVLTLGLQKVEVTASADDFDYVDFLMENEFFYMNAEADGRISMGNNEYYLDDEGNLLIKVCVALRCDGLDMCYVDLDLMDFPMQ